MNPELPTQLAERLRKPLPGWKGQRPLEPEFSFGRHRGPAPQDARAAAVMILLYPHADAWHVPLILRPSDMPSHPGQISFPGGLIEPREASSAAALRELHEELGVTADRVQLLGRLSELYLYVTKHRVVPWVGTIATRPDWKVSPREVERLLEVPLGHLFDESNVVTYAGRNRGLEFQAPSYAFESASIWGATGMILAELLAALGGLAI